MAYRSLNSALILVTLEKLAHRIDERFPIHQLRSIAHVVDMHQLTKDPHQLLAEPNDTASSPVRTMTHAELARYLDYCSELLSLDSDVAALFVQELNDQPARAGGRRRSFRAYKRIVAENLAEVDDPRDGRPRHAQLVNVSR
jgi:hypothetical protein